MSFNLSLDETADKQDSVIEVDGLNFLADARAKSYVDGLEIDVEEYYGREGLVAFNRNYGGGC